MELVREKVATLRNSGSFVIALVYSTLLLDSMLYSAVVPVLPEYFCGSQIESLQTNATLPNISAVECDRLSSGAQNVVDANLYMGILYSSKYMTELVSNVFVGPLTNTIGYDIPIFAANFITCASSTLFAFGTTFPVLLVARAIQGFGSACVITAGMGMVADRFSDDKRGKAMGLALGGQALGELVGPVFGGVIYGVSGKKEPIFLVISSVALILTFLQFLLHTIKLERQPPREEGIPFLTLVLDPYIVLVLASLVFVNMCESVTETAQPIWMITTMSVKKWEIGLSMLPTSVMFLCVTNLVALCCQRVPKWLLCVTGLYSICVGSIALPFAKRFVGTIAPGLCFGVGYGLVESSMYPIMATLVDTRYKPVYGSVYAMVNIAFCVTSIIGPLLAGGVITIIGFPWLLRIIAITLFFFAPLVLFLRITPKQEESMSLLHNTTSTEEDSAVSMHTVNNEHVIRAK